MRIANLLFASAAFADTNIDQLTKKVRIFQKYPKIFWKFIKIPKFFWNFFEKGDENDSVCKKTLILISQVAIKQCVWRYPVRF